MTVLQEQTPTLSIRTVRSSEATELYITAMPGSGAAAEQATDLYRRIAAELRREDAAITGERIFAGESAFADVLPARAAALGDIDDGVKPSLLLACEHDGILGVQVHAISGIGSPAVLPGARKYICRGRSYLEGSGLHAPALPDGPSQARRTFEMMGDLVRRSGASLSDVARTWLWMDEILNWYPQLNKVRNDYFTQQGLFSRPGGMPASTGIGISPRSARIALDFLAAWGADGIVQRFHAIGNQRSAYEYGSAFARASQVQTPGGVTVFCSGTAAIDGAGKTCHLGDIAGQVAMTIDNVHAVLRDMHCQSSDVVQAMAYCATPAVAEHFAAEYRDALGWPVLTMLGDVCRGDLLFEIEVTACPK